MSRVSSLRSSTQQPAIDFAQVRRAAPLVLVISHYGLDAELKRVGSQLRGCCPIHKGSNPAQFVVDPRKGVWRCFGDCNRGGGSLELVAEIEHLDVRGAATLIAEWFAIPTQQTVRDPPHQQRRTPVSGKPSHKVYAVEDREVDPSENDGDDNKAFWTRVGSAWPHKDGKGLNIVLSALPVNARLVLREYTPEDEKVDAEKAKKQQRYTKK